MKTPNTRFRPTTSRQLFEGVQHVYRFGSHRVSVVCHQYSYGGSCGLWEAMVDDQEPHGWLTDAALDTYLAEVAA